MAFWTSEKFSQRQADLIVEPFVDKRLNQGAYELALGEAYDTYTKKKITYNESSPQIITIPSGHFALLLTKEKITIPKDVIGFISIKAKIKFRGLINVSGFHVDPGYSGKLMFSVYNAGSREVVIAQGDELFLLWFSDLTETTTDFYKKSGKTTITPEDIMNVAGNPVSLPDLDKRLTRLEYAILAFGGVFTVLVAISIYLFNQSSKSTHPTPNETSHKVHIVGPPLIDHTFQRSPESSNSKK